VHSVGDRLIRLEEIQPLAAAWAVPLVALESAVRPGALDCEQDDINHDFLSKDLMLWACKQFQALLADIENIH